jgi:hypothetical protein
MCETSSDVAGGSVSSRLGTVSDLDQRLVYISDRRHVDLRSTLTAELTNTCGRRKGLIIEYEICLSSHHDHSHWYDACTMYTNGMEEGDKAFKAHDFLQARDASVCIVPKLSPFESITDSQAETNLFRQTYSAIPKQQK